jgi:hypothetical protein
MPSSASRASFGQPPSGSGVVVEQQGALLAEDGFDLMELHPGPDAVDVPVRIKLAEKIITPARSASEGISLASASGW